MDSLRLLAGPADKLLMSYRAAMRSADTLPAPERALVVHALVESSAQARDRLRSRANGSDALAGRFEEFRSSIVGEDTIGAGLGVASEHRNEILSFVLAVGGWLGAVGAGILAAISATSQSSGALTPAEMAELQMRLRQMVGPVIAYGGTILAWAGGLVKWWNDRLAELWRMGTQARGVLQASVDQAEREFFSSLGVPNPPRSAVSVAGPAASVGWIVGTAVVVLVVLGVVFGVIDV